MNIKGKMREKSGITLITLVVTIIVLLILAGVTIAALSGENGILTRASDAKVRTEIASVKEQAQLDIANYVAEKIKNGEDATVDSPEKVQQILNEANAGKNKYYKELQEDKIITPSGYEVSFEELYTSASTEEVTEITVANYGDRVNYKSKGDSSLIWRIFYDDDNYIYLISSKADGSNTVDDCNLNEKIGVYNGSADIDENLKFLNQQWFDNVKDNPSTSSKTAKAVAYLMDQNVWDIYKDSAGNASYAIGGPTLELFKNSYNKSEETSNEIEIESCDSEGYSEDTSITWILETYNNGIYNNGKNSYWWIASPCTYGGIFGVCGDLDIGGGILSYSIVYDSLGLRPIVIIPKAKFQYKIIPET